MDIEPRLSSRSEFLRVRGLRYHLRRWGDPRAPVLFLGHGWLDSSASFQALVEPLLSHWQVIAPDWRGFGHTQWAQDGYWFPDYLADFDEIAAHYAPDEPFILIGHSMAAQIFSLYAGLRPERVKRLICLDGLYLPDDAHSAAPARLGDWLRQLQQLETDNDTHASYEALAQRIRRLHRHLTTQQAVFVAHCWGSEDGFGRVRWLADPKHRLRTPHLYRVGESMAVWSRVQAPTLFVDARRSQLHAAIHAEERQRRLACFRQREVTEIDAGHMLHWDAPQQTAAAIIAFLHDSRQGGMTAAGGPGYTR